MPAIRLFGGMASPADCSLSVGNFCQCVYI